MKLGHAAEVDKKNSRSDDPGIATILPVASIRITFDMSVTQKAPA